ncbi:MAG: mechanosensitive ion channel [Clostridia bacterium]
MQDFWKKLAEMATEYGFKILGAIIILVVGMKLAKIFTKSLSKSKGFKKLDVAVHGFILSFLKISLNVVVFLTAAFTLGVPMTTFVTVLASGGLAAGLALQGALSNLAGGLMILIFKPFVVGDYVTAAGESGVVTSITVFYTILRTYDNKQITVPNGKVMSDSVTDFSAEKYRRVDLKFSTSYTCDVEKTKQLLINTALENLKVKKEPLPYARLAEHGSSSLNFILRVWCDTDDYWDVLYDMNEQVKKAFDDNQIEIPFQQIDIHAR